MVRCWNCGRQLEKSALGDYGVICECGIDHWRNPLPVPVVEDEVYIGKYHVLGE